MELNSVIRRNIETLRRKRAEEERAVSGLDRNALLVSRFAGSMSFVVVNVLGLAGWVVVNLGLVPFAKPFDSSFVALATTASVEALFLSTFILISQNRAARIADRQSDLDVQISLLTEHEVTRVLKLCTMIAERLDVHGAQDPELEELKDDVAPDRVIDEIEMTQKRAAPKV